MSRQKVVLFVVYNDKTKSVLSEHRAKDHPLYPNLKTFPTGKLNRDESFEKALQREIKEELGIVPLKFVQLGLPIQSSKGNNLLYPFLILDWGGNLPTHILDKGNRLVWETLDEISLSSISTRPVIAQRVKDYLSNAK
ncbi:hypothetical protein A3I53_00095 [Candidatus Curtissbacteria bacterium RIFCSPLOWO2_02_FULL_40_13b]|uniref:Nudix hydrolase domain-containing protein n=1 Tax=Candidatus Curtissbacteria bacterium RIFCSPLOWO2_02_FULL_40_13b TaxID=1797733 RepID=A0A1F5HSW3_9BACT|nr:MAG: hypothetical protein A3I53_00095 [Candidatus Curtissbacteria bacterium RIFCSPLOWO2_02_FULL_40_13b]